MEKILLVEDDAVFPVLIERLLQKEAELVHAPDLATAKRLFESEPFDPVLLDLHLPDGDGLQLCRSIRAGNFNQNCIIMILSGDEEIKTKALGYSLGADDYLVKSFDPLEIKLKIDSVLKRLRSKKADENFLKKGELLLDLTRAKAFFVENDSTKRDLGLSLTEFRLLQFLVQREGQIFTRDQLLDQVWSDGVCVVDRNVDNYISRIRKKIGPRGKHYIRSSYGQGYSFAT